MLVYLVFWWILSSIKAFGCACLQVAGVEAIRQHFTKKRHFAFTGQAAGIATGHLIFPLIVRGLLLVSPFSLPVLIQI